MKQFLNISGYRFQQLSALNELRRQLLKKCSSLSLKGTILLSEEGININLVGLPEDIFLFKEYLENDAILKDISFKESFSKEVSFDRLKVKIKNEIITMRHPEIRPQEKTAPSVTPQEFKKWLDNNKEMMILDTRNDYEMAFGQFKNAINLHLNDFNEFAEKSSQLEKNKPVIMYCTGGIRCEKAAWHLLNQGFNEVYQLEGGILNYFQEVGQAYFEGECYVFDKRISLDAALSATGTKQCVICQGPIKTAQGKHICNHSLKSVNSHNKDEVNEPRSY